MNFLKYDLRLEKNDVVEVSLDKQANVRLLDRDNFQSYQRDQKHKYYGGLPKGSPFRIPAPSSGALVSVCRSWGLSRLCSSCSSYSRVVAMSEYLPAIKRAKIERLNFAIFFVSSVISFLVTLLTTTITPLRVFAVIVIFCTAGFVAAAVLFALWLWYRQSRATIFSDIRQRMPPDGTPAIEPDV